MKRNRPNEVGRAELLRQFVSDWMPTIKYVVFEIGLLVIFAYSVWIIVGRETGFA